MFIKYILYALLYTVSITHTHTHKKEKGKEIEVLHEVLVHFSFLVTEVINVMMTICRLN